MPQSTCRETPAPINCHQFFVCNISLVRQHISDALLALHIGYYLKLSNDLTVSEMLLLLLLADIIAKQGAAILVFPGILGLQLLTCHYLPHLKKQAIETWDFFHMF